MKKAPAPARPDQDAHPHAEELRRIAEPGGGVVATAHPEATHGDGVARILVENGRLPARDERASACGGAGVAQRREAFGTDHRIGAEGELEHVQRAVRVVV
jgi:hypothetical protein